MPIIMDTQFPLFGLNTAGNQVNVLFARCLTIQIAILNEILSKKQHKEKRRYKVQPHLKSLKVSFHHALKEEPVIYNVRLPQQSTVGHVLNVIKKKVELSHPDAELRLLAICYHKIYKIFPLTEEIGNINDGYWALRAEEIPKEEKNRGPKDHMIRIYHFTKEAYYPMHVQNFGKPFFRIIHENETLEAVKVRIQSKLEVPDEEFSKWKFAFVFHGRPEYLSDSDIVFTSFQRREVSGNWDPYLGLEHLDTTCKTVKGPLK